MFAGARAHVFTSRPNNEHMNVAYVSTVESNRNHKMQKIDTHLFDRKKRKKMQIREEIIGCWMLVSGVYIRIRLVRSDDDNWNILFTTNDFIVLMTQEYIYKHMLGRPRADRTKIYEDLKI